MSLQYHKYITHLFIVNFPFICKHDKHGSHVKNFHSCGTVEIHRMPPEVRDFNFGENTEKVGMLSLEQGMVDGNLLEVL